MCRAVAESTRVRGVWAGAAVAHPQTWAVRGPHAGLCAGSGLPGFRVGRGPGANPRGCRGRGCTSECTRAHTHGTCARAGMCTHMPTRPPAPPGWRPGGRGLWAASPRSWTVLPPGLDGAPASAPAPDAPRVSSLSVFFGSFVVSPGPQTFFLSQDSHPRCRSQRWADRLQTRTPAPICLFARPASSSLQAPHPHVDETSFPPRTCPFKSPGARRACPQGRAGGGWTAVVGGSFVSSQGPLRGRAPGKLKQRPTMAPSLPGRPRSRACTAASGGPCYFLCWLRGSWPAANGQEAGWASPPHLPGGPPRPEQPLL